MFRASFLVRRLATVSRQARLSPQAQKSLLPYAAHRCEGRYFSTNFRSAKGHFDTIILRDEVKDHEKRTPLLPKQASALIDQGYKVMVESSSTRIYPDALYREAGATIIPSHSFWSEDYITDKTIVLGLKELPLDGKVIKTSQGKEIVVPDKIIGAHIYFAHTYKYQTGWSDVMKRFDRGDGVLLDLEYLVDDNLKRVAAFGEAAGYSGMALGLLSWAKQQTEIAEGFFNNTPALPYDSKETLIKEIQTRLKDLGRYPKISIVGPNGRCGRGSIDCVRDVFGDNYSNLVLWSRSETTPDKAPFYGMLESDILVNDIFAAGDMEPFFTMDFATDYKDRKLSMFVDVSCDITSKKKAFPLNDELTSFDEPRRRVYAPASGLPIDVIAIDNLPTLLPSYSSESYSANLFPFIEKLKHVDFYDPDLEKCNLWSNDWNSSFKWSGPEHKEIRVWQRAFQLFQKKKHEGVNTN